jgi:hypothetical protein
MRLLTAKTQQSNSSITHNQQQLQRVENIAIAHTDRKPHINILCGEETDRLCGLVVRVLDYRCRGPGFDSRALQQK